MDLRVAALVACVGLAVLAGGTTAIGPTVDGGPGDGVRASATVDDDSSIPVGTDLEPDCPVAARDAVGSADEENGSHGPATTDVNTPRIVELYPNPTIHDNVGEYLVLEVPPGTRLEPVTITDGHTTATLPNETASGRVAVSADPDVTGELTDAPVLELEGHLRLAADGDDLELHTETGVVDAISYDRAPQAERWYRSADDGDRAGSTTASADGTWHPRGATCLPVTAADVDEATAFVLPDAPEVPRETIREADDRLLLAGYTVTDDDVAADLVAAADRGVDVAVLLEGSPVGGTPQATEAVLETLERGGVDVRVLGGEGSRYRYHHPKYAVADDRVLVTSENWKPAGVGGASSRGWGVRLADDALADDLATVFEADHGGWDTESGTTYRETTSFVDDESTGSPSRSFPTEHEPTTHPVASAELLVAPDNAEKRLTELIADAEDELLVKQASVDGDAAVLEETVDAARRGVAVEILLDSTWYHEDENRVLADDLERIAEDESLPLEVRLVGDTDRFEKIHAKGVVVDREVAVVGSANWNDNAFRNNREVVLALHGEEIAEYYADVFEDDWDGDGGSWRLPFGLSLTVLGALAVAAVVGRRYVRFGSPQPREGDRN